MLKINIFLLILNNILLIYGEIDYCDKDLLCKNAAGPHIKCNNDGKFSSECEADVKLIQLKSKDKKNIVEAHNEKRNKIAAGEIPGYAQAKRMAQMVWSTELEKMAELHVKRCKFQHDKCRNTPNYLYSGQNLFTWSGYPAPANPMEHFYTAINNWFLEYKNCDMSLINNFRNERLNDIGHFTVMVTEQNKAVGCAAILFTQGKFTKIIITCNYASTNSNNKSVYKAGKKGSGCKKGLDKKFRALCTVNEIYNINEL